MMTYLGQLHELRLGHLPSGALRYEVLVVRHDAGLILSSLGHQNGNLRIK